MKLLIQNLTYVTALAMFLISTSFAQPPEKKEPDMLSCKNGMPTETLTVYHNISGLSSRRGHATKLTELHAKHRLEGWDFKEMALHHENGDLEGFYITYVRTSC